MFRPVLGPFAPLVTRDHLLHWRTTLPYDLGSFSLLDMLKCGREVRAVASEATSLEEAAGSVVRYLYGSGERPVRAHSLL